MVGIRGRIDLNWTAPSNVTDIDGFRIFRSTDGGITYALHDEVADPAARTWFESGLADATKYTYRVRAYSDDAGSSYTTNKVSVVTTLPAPSDVGVSLIGGTSALVSWTPSPASTTTGYSIYKLSPGSSAQLVGQAAANATSFQVTA